MYGALGPSLESAGNTHAKRLIQNLDHAIGTRLHTISGAGLAPQLPPNEEGRVARMIAENLPRQIGPKWSPICNSPLPSACVGCPTRRFPKNPPTLCKQMLPIAYRCMPRMFTASIIVIQLQVSFCIFSIHCAIVEVVFILSPKHAMSRIIQQSQFAFFHAPV